MTARVFVDSNVLVYSLDTTEADKQHRAAGWMEFLWSSRRGRLSFQVLQEFYVNVTRKVRAPVEPDDARQVVRSLLAWQPLSVGAGEIEAAWAIQDRNAVSWWDALIVAAAESLDCRYLLTEDLQHEQVLGGVRIVDPFRIGPGDLPAD